MALHCVACCHSSCIGLPGRQLQQMHGACPAHALTACERGAGGKQAAATASSGLEPWRVACVAYRAGQKKLVRSYLVAARKELQETLVVLQAAVERESGMSTA